MEENDRRILVERFLRRCVTYANESIRRKSDRGVSEEEIAKWVVYRDFTLHAAAVSYTHLTLPTIALV